MYGVIYIIENLINGNKYIGQSTDFKVRKERHLNALRKSDLVIVNRCDENTKKYPIRGSIKSLNPMCQIVYENKNRQIEDLTVNDLPYNLNDDYIEVNDINPLNAGSYIMDDAPFFDYVILFAANIRGVGSDATLYNNPNVQYILDHKDTLIKPLQDKEM